MKHILAVEEGKVGGERLVPDLRSKEKALHPTYLFLTHLFEKVHSTFRRCS